MLKVQGLRSALTSWPWFHDMGVEGANALVRLCHVKFVIHLWARILAWFKARGWMWPSLTVGQNCMSPDGHADRGCSAALLQDSAVKFLVEWLQVALFCCRAVWAWCSNGLLPDYKQMGMAQKPPTFINVIWVTSLFCTVKNKGEYWKVFIYQVFWEESMYSASQS